MSDVSYKEIEYKYWAKDLSKEDFLLRIDTVSSNIGVKAPNAIYVVSCDDYYICDSNNFVRFRKGGSLYELTIKRKERDNVIRREINLNVSNNDDSAIVEFLTLSGYKKEFQVYKEAWIWDFEECDISYYTLSDGRSVIELESKNYSSVKDGVSIIDKWEKLLGLRKLEKESRSLYEIFTEERSL